MRRLLYFSLLSLAILLGPGACDDSASGPSLGEIRGIVLVEGAGLPGVTVELTGPESRTLTTAEDGRYHFDELSSGTYVVSISGLPPGASFPALSRTAMVSGFRTVIVDFVGGHDRTAAISGVVTARDQGVADVTVLLQGPEVASTRTDGAGAFRFPDLRAGSYEVEVAGFPPSVSFPFTRTVVELGVGEEEVLNFEGDLVLTATVVIQSITRSFPDGGTEPVSPDDVRGTVDVTLAVDRGEDTVEEVLLLLDGDEVGRQVFNPQAAKAPSFQVAFPVRTGEFDDETGEVRFRNGERPLTARLATREGGAEAWTSTVFLTLKNQDTFAGRVEASRGPATDEAGDPWVAGSLEAEVIPVLYAGDRQVESVTVVLGRSGGGALRTRTGGGEFPLRITFPASGEAGPDNVVGYQTPRGAVDELRVSAGAFADGEAVPGVPAVLAGDLRVDNVAPPAGSFQLPRQSEEEDCCRGNWVGAPFPFEAAYALEEDAGVGGLEVTFHVGPSGEDDEDVADRPAVRFGGEVDPSLANSAYRAVATVRDALGNSRTVALEPSPGNSLANELGGVFGVDDTSPILTFDEESVENQAVNPPTGSAWILDALDEGAGLSASPARTTVRLLAPGADGQGACPFPGTELCLPAPDGLEREVPSDFEGYYTFRSRVLDRGGNPSGQVSAQVLRDLTPPEMGAVALPGSLEGGAEVGFSVPVWDNVDLHLAWIRLRFGPPGAGSTERLPFIPASLLGRPFDGALATLRTLEASFPLVVGLERAGGEGEPSGEVRILDGASLLVMDAAGNERVREEDLPGAQDLEPRSFAVSERGAEGGVRRWSLSSDGERVCREGTVDCPADAGAAVTLHAVARGEGGTLERPFAAVYFYRIRDGLPDLIGGSEEGTVVSDESGPEGREWRWSLEWTPGQEVPSGPAVLLAVGVDEEGSALRSGDLTTLSVVD